MRSPTLLLLITTMLTPSAAQKVMRLSDAGAIGLTTEHLDSLYWSAFNMQDSTKAAFPGRMEEYLTHWEQTLGELDDHFKQAGFKWAVDTRLTYRSFFTADGKLEMFHYVLRDPMDPQQEQEFQRIMTSFVDRYRFPMRAEVPFRQCGSTSFKASGTNQGQ